MTQPTSPTSGPITNFVANEPVVVSYGVTWLLAQIGAFLIGHTHLLTATEWGSVSSYLAPIVITAVLGALAFVTRKFVVPIIKKIDPNL